MSDSESTSEKFRIRGIGKEWDLPCFVTGQPPASEGDLKTNISGFVESKEAGERIVAMFGGAARLDYREDEPNWIQVKVGASPEHEGALEHLAELVKRADNTITPELIARAKALHARDTSAQTDERTRGGR